MDRRLHRLDSSTRIGNELAQLVSVAGLAFPALGIVVVDPLMSLVDTACIGRTSTMQLAALAPNSAVFNMVFQARTRAHSCLHTCWLLT
jgi:Na+-driven multidrug efflux pump